jgi:site-specific DNA-adenine methylase
MFNYYGGKSKVASLYPAPLHSTIIEPFAGAAAYSALHSDKKVLLNDTYCVVYNIWRWLIDEATPEGILDNVDFYVGQDIRSLDIPQPHKDLIGFCINRGNVSPCNIVQKWSCQVKSRPNWASTTNYRLKQIAKTLPKIRHWSVSCVDYKQLPDIEATWFIDPPYQYGGNYYVESRIDYGELADWCKSRKGQVIVCENTKADWLIFRPLITITGQRHKTTEAVWMKL